MKGSVTDVACHVCAAPALELVEGFEALHRVTSDCKPWLTGGRLCVCRACGCVQKAVDVNWLFEIEKIYGNYSIYHQSDGVEQAVFESGSGQASTRSARLLEALAVRVALPDEGRMLDLGCGSGAMLRAFSRFAPRWTLAGSELSDKTRETVESIAKVEALYIGEPQEIPGNFDVVTMSHLLEHIPQPIEYLARLQDKLSSGGLLVIEVPNYLQNPFDLLVADHASHFTASQVAGLIERAGYEVMWAATDWVPKELSIVARKTTPQIEARQTKPEPDPFNTTTKMVQWLKDTADAARACATRGSFGILGTSIAGTWLFAEVGDAVSFFVDEDPARIGRTFMGRNVYHPGRAPAGSHVFVGLPPMIAEGVRGRVSKPGVTLHLPPELPDMA